MSNMPDKVYLITPSYNKNIRKGYEGVLKTWAKTINKEIPVQIISLSESSKNIDNIIIQSSSVNAFQIIFNLIVKCNGCRQCTLMNILIHHYQFC